MFMILSLLLRLLRFREVKPFAHIYTAKRRHSWELNPSSNQPVTTVYHLLGKLKGDHRFPRWEKSAWKK